MLNIIIKIILGFVVLVSYANDQDQTCTQGQECQSCTKIEKLEERLQQNENLVRQLQDSVQSLKKELQTVRLSFSDVDQQSPAAVQTIQGSEPTERALISKSEFSKTLARRIELWADHTQFTSAIKTDGDITSIHVVESLGTRGGVKYVLIGDSIGKLYFFKLTGELMHEHRTGDVAVTALVAHTVTFNVTAVTVGFSDGNIQRLHAHETQQALSVASQTNIESVVKISDLLSGTRSASSEDADSQDSGSKDVRLQRQSPVTKLVQQRLGPERRLITVQLDGGIRVLSDNCTVKFSAPVSSQVFDVRSRGMRLQLVTSSGFQLLQQGKNSSLQSIDCEGQHESILAGGVFDEGFGTRVFMLSTLGELLMAYIGGDGAELRCVIRSRVWVPFPVTSQATLAPIKGFLLIASQEGVAVYNTTMATRSGPRFVLYESYDSLKGQFGWKSGDEAGLGADAGEGAGPKLVVGKHGDVAMNLGGGVGGVYSHSFNVYKAQKDGMSLLQQPLFIAAMVMVGIWQYTRARSSVPSTSKGYMNRYSSYIKDC